MKKFMNLNFFDAVDIEKIAQKSLKVKLGFDPTAPNLHLGHFVVLNNAKKLQQMGHQIIILIGDFTASIGDPTGKNAARPPLSAQQIKSNAETYLEQVFMVLDKEKTKIVFNSDWLAKLSVTDFIKIISSQTIQQITARDDFKKRIDTSSPVFMHELIYPIMQGYDSVALKADVELGGQDQWFNLLMGRELQKMNQQPQQALITFPLLLGLDGVHKMSKSLGNDIGFLEAPKEKFGKVMSIDDKTMSSWIEVLNIFTPDEHEQLKNMPNPKDQKMFLAQKVVQLFHGEKEALNQKEVFIQQFQKKDIQEVLKDKEPIVIGKDLLELEIREHQQGYSLSKILVKTKILESHSEALRKIKEGAIKINGEKTFENVFFPIPDTQEIVLQFGKKVVEKISFEKAVQKVYKI